MAPLRIAVAKFWHESNTFNSVETPLAAFETEGAYSGVKLGAAALPSGDDRNSELSGMLRAFAASSAICEEPKRAMSSALPSMRPPFMTPPSRVFMFSPAASAPL